MLPRARMDARRLLSAKLPRVERPAPTTHEVRRFRLPSCVVPRIHRQATVILEPPPMSAQHPRAKSISDVWFDSEPVLDVDPIGDDEPPARKSLHVLACTIGGAVVAAAVVLFLL